MNVRELYDAVLTDVEYHDARLVPVDGIPAPHRRFFAKLVRRLCPKYVVELGTGTGRTSAQILSALPSDGQFVTINWPNPPSGEDVGIELMPWRPDPRLRQLIGDTRMAFQFIESGIDLLYIDSTHTSEHVMQEWEAYRPKLVNGAIVVVDDIDFPKSDMREFWNPLPYDKVEIVLGDHAAGMFRYEEQRLWP